ncbi:cation efflux system protein [Bacteroidia bacterium]|nr:cation efflux system protein [Bacteroidia bacterium]
MEHHHHEHHHHALDLKSTHRAFVIGIVLNVVFVVVEAIAGFVTDSLALLADAGHNLADVASLVIALLALKLSAAKSNERYTYGYKKSTVLAAFINAVILLVAVGGIVYEALERILTPVPVEGGVVVAVAGVGIAINAITALLFFRDKDKDLNIKGAYLHLAADAIVSVGVVIAGIVIAYTQWYWMDSAISLLVAVVIFVSTWALLKSTIRLSLDGVPHGINPIEVAAQIAAVEGVENVHHLHIWALSTTQNALTCHVVLCKQTSWDDVPRIKAEIRTRTQSLGVRHSTIEIENYSELCENNDE